MSRDVLLNSGLFSYLAGFQINLDFPWLEGSPFLGHRDALERWNRDRSQIYTFDIHNARMRHSRHQLSQLCAGQRVGEADMCGLTDQARLPVNMLYLQNVSDLNAISLLRETASLYEGAAPTVFLQEARQKAHTAASAVLEIAGIIVTNFPYFSPIDPMSEYRGRNLLL